MPEEETVAVERGVSRRLSMMYDDGRLEGDAEGYCKTCGVPLPFNVWFFEGFERCPDCYLEIQEKRVARAFGTTETVDLLSGGGPGAE